MHFPHLEEDDHRSPSPWDKFTSPSPADPSLEIQMRAGDGIPQLVPEVEEGNVEYKLKLLNPTPERFNRLVTQLNWRLMEGNGQAYYQLGVADSGQLVGLTRAEMEATLETLEAMAGEIGASILINREIEVSGRLLAGLRGSTWWRTRRLDTGSAPNTGSYASVSHSASGQDTESSETDDVSSSPEDEDEPAESPNAAAGSLDLDCDPNEIIVRSAPVPITHAMLRRPLSIGMGTSPNPGSFSDSLRGFGAKEDNGSDDGADLGVFGLGDLDLSSGFVTASKPMPIPSNGEARKPIQAKRKTKKPPNPFISPKSQEEIAARAACKRQKRDQRRSERKRGTVSNSAPIAKKDESVAAASTDSPSGGPRELTADALDELTAALDASFPRANNGSGAGQTKAKLTNSIAGIPHINKLGMTNASQDDDTTTVAAAPVEPTSRLIVEALVVRKAGFGSGFVDLSRFDEEISQLPNFSLS